jgi:energy-dependent translational throttle protein EttA
MVVVLFYQKNGILIILGPYSVGKSIVFRMLMGEENPDFGTMTIERTIKLAYVNLLYNVLLPDKTLYMRF